MRQPDKNSIILGIMVACGDWPDVGNPKMIEGVPGGSEV